MKVDNLAESLSHLFVHGEDDAAEGNGENDESDETDSKALRLLFKLVCDHITKLEDAVLSLF